MHSESDMDLSSFQPITENWDHIYEHGCQATREERERARARQREIERSGGREKNSHVVAKRRGKI